MKIYFEDGPLKEDVSSLEFGVDDCVIIDAKFGVFANRKELDFAYKNNPNDTIYTNSILALHNKYTWNDELECSEIYLRDKNGKWKIVQDFTTRQIREAHNIANLYLNGAFDE